MPPANARNPRAEASDLLGDGRIGLVLEPSRPAVTEGPWFADDPAVPTAVEAPTAVVPLGSGPRSWEDAIKGDATLAEFARDRWLANLKPLDQPPTNLAHTRAALTSLAFYVLAPARQAANGKIGLRWTKGGFGTPFFGDDRQVRVEGDQLVVQDGDSVVSEPITTLRAAGELVGIAPAPPTGIEFHDAPPVIGHDEPLSVDVKSVAYLDDWFGFSTHLLQRLLLSAGLPQDTRVQLWAEHFDPAVELGDAESGSRASYGASPGDAGTPSPYLYVSPWSPQEGEFWSAPFGAGLGINELVQADDPVAVGLAFFEKARSLLS